MTTAYPLAWPAGWPRAKVRADARFNSKVDTGHGYSKTKAVTLVEARDRLSRELDLLKVRYVTLSTNLELRLDGQPRGGAPEPADPGVAVYFERGTTPTVLACDRWNRVADNIAAVAAHVGALRGMERWGVGTADQMFAGYEALAAPEGWWRVLGLKRSATAAEVEAAFRAQARTSHPDAGGSNGAMARLNAARDAAILEISA